MYMEVMTIQIDYPSEANVAFHIYIYTCLVPTGDDAVGRQSAKSGVTFHD